MKRSHEPKRPPNGSAFHRVSKSSCSETTSNSSRKSLEPLPRKAPTYMKSMSTPSNCIRSDLRETRRNSIGRTKLGSVKDEWKKKKKNANLNLKQIQREETSALLRSNKKAGEWRIHSEDIPSTSDGPCRDIKTLDFSRSNGETRKYSIGAFKFGNRKGEEMEIKSETDLNSKQIQRISKKQKIFHDKKCVSTSTNGSCDDLERIPIGQPVMTSTSTLTSSLSSNLEKQSPDSPAAALCKYLNISPESPISEPKESSEPKAEEKVNKYLKRCLSEATRLFNKRRRLLNEADRCTKGKQPERTKYLYQLAVKVNQAFERAQSKAVMINLVRGRMTGVLDLHLLKAPEAETAVDIFIDEHVAKLMEGPEFKSPDLIIITGRGKNSMNGDAIIKPVVAARLKERKIEYTFENPGRIKLHVYRSTCMTNWLPKIEEN